MCKSNKKAIEEKQAIELLKLYVSESEPRINKQLRTNQADSHEVALFDSLFADNAHPEYVYRWLPSCYVKNNDGILTDKAYLSCSSDPSCFIDHIFGKDLTCYMINTCEELKIINVNALLPNYNNEGEYILPRELILEVKLDKTYRQSDFAQFLSDIQCCNIRDTEMIYIYQIESIRLIKANTRCNTFDNEILRKSYDNER